MTRLKTTVLLMTAALLAGCGAEPNTPDPTSVTAIKQRTLERIEVLEQEIADGGVDPEKVRQFSTSLNYLIGHVKTAGVASEELIYQLKEARFAISSGKASRPLPPRDWQPDKDGGKVPDVRVQPGKLGQMLSALRDLINEIPDSDEPVVTD